jgi:hypothetical protein
VIPDFVRPPNGYPWGVLPLDPKEEGWLMTVAEFAARFGRGVKRAKMAGKLGALLDWLEKEGFRGFVLVAGSFVEGKPEPCDVDLSVFLQDPSYSEQATRIAERHARDCGCTKPMTDPSEILAMFEAAFVAKLTRPHAASRGAFVHYMDVFGPYRYVDFDRNADYSAWERLQFQRIMHSVSRPRQASGMADESGVKCRKGFVRIEFGR